MIDLSFLSSACWFFIGVTALVASFNDMVRKTVMECVALGGVSLGAFSRSYYVYMRHETDPDALWISIALALYCLAMWYKMMWVIPHRPDYKPPPKSRFY